MTFRSVVKMIIGIGVTALGVVSCVIFLKAFLALLLGIVGPLLVFIGLVMIAVAKE